jgi:WD40 repeat protein
MCLDFHPQHPSLLAVGCYDGTVMVFDVRKKANRPIYTSSIKTGKHTDPVWQVGAPPYPRLASHTELSPCLRLSSLTKDSKANWSTHTHTLSHCLTQPTKPTSN